MVKAYNRKAKVGLGGPLSDYWGLSVHEQQVIQSSKIEGQTVFYVLSPARFLTSFSLISHSMLLGRIRCISKERKKIL